MKKIFFFTSFCAALVSLGWVNMTAAIPVNNLEEVACSQFGLPNDEQCFKGPRLYVGEGIPTLTDTMTNPWNSNIYFFQTNPWTGAQWYDVTFEKFQGTNWAIPGFEVNFEPGQWTNFNLRNKQHPGITILPGETKTILRSRENSPLVFIKENALADREKPILKMTVTTVDHGAYVPPNNPPQPSRKLLHTHKENAFFYGSWCGDGVLDPQFEEADDGKNNGKPWFASTDCKRAPNIVTGVCDGASNGVPTRTAPTANLCKTGTPSVVVDQGDKFTWTCNGVNGGENKTCEAPKDVPPPPPPTTKNVCDQVFESRKLRVGSLYVFDDSFNNNNWNSYTLNSFDATLTENYGDDINSDNSFTFKDFHWKSPYTAGSVIPPHAKGLKIIESSPYKLIKAPKQRLKDNILVEYIVNHTQWWQTVSHKECQPYEVTWCGDGIIDTDRGEICDPAAPGQSADTCDIKTCQPKKPEPRPSLQIKKFAKGQDAQVSGQAVEIAPNEEYPYTFEVTNTSNVVAKWAKVVDIFPDTITVVKTWQGTDWTCTQDGQIMTCLYNKEIPAGQKSPTITAIAKVKETVQSGNSIRNVAGVCEFDPKKPRGSEDCTPDRNECKPGDKEYNPTTRTCDPSTIIITSKPGIEIKKFVSSIDGSKKDWQNFNDSLEVDYGKVFKYIYEIKTSGNASQNRVTVTDKFPKGVIINDFTSGGNFTCKKGKDGDHETAICQSNTAVAPNTTTQIEVFVRLATEAELAKYNLPQDVFTKGLRNIAYVCSNEAKTTGPNGEKVCAPDCIDPNNSACLPPPPPAVCEPWDKTSPNYDPACIVPKKPNNDISIKKYTIANGSTQDGQQYSAETPQINFGDAYQYKYTITPKGEIKNATVTDTFPKGVKVTGFEKLPNGWSCEKGVGSNGHHSVICHNPLIPNNSAPIDIIVNAQLFEENEFMKLGLPEEIFSKGLRNIAYVCAENTNNSKTIFGKSSEDFCKPVDKICIPGTPACPTPPPPPETVCSTEVGDKNYDPACIIPKPKLEIQKLAKGQDANTAVNRVTVEAGEEYDYTFIVRNTSKKVAHSAKVIDILPDAIEVIGTAKWDGWTCTQNGQTMTCNYVGEIAPNQVLPTITLRAKIKSTVRAGDSIRNVAAVCEPHDKDCTPNRDICKPGDKDYNPVTKSCDPSTVTIVPGKTYMIGYCINENGGNSDANKTIAKDLQSVQACIDKTGNTNAKNKTACLEQNEANEKAIVQDLARLNCSKPTPPTYTPPGPGTPPPASYCGDGIVDKSKEQCDPGTGRGPNDKQAYADRKTSNGNIICSKTCDSGLSTTNPGEDELKYMITIPGFATLGTSSSGVKPFESHGMIVGKGSKIFALQDEVKLSVESKHNLARPVIAGTEFSIGSDNKNFEGGFIKKWIDTLSYKSFKQPDVSNRRGDNFYVIGNAWDYFTMPVNSEYNKYDFKCVAVGSPSTLLNCQLNANSNDKVIFKGFDLQGIKAKEFGTSKIELKSNDFELTSFRVDIIKPSLSSLWSGVDRQVGTFMNNFGRDVNAFVKQSSTTKNDSSFPFGKSISRGAGTNIEILKIDNTCPVGTVSNFESITHKGNPNIYACNGSLTIGAKTNLTGVKTLIVNGNITFEGNIGYSDINASWAFIAQNGNIIVKENVTNLAGVLVALKKNNDPDTGKFKGDSTANILQVEGSMYGNATDLFNARTYGRYNSNYQSLTTGTVINYSNRALRNPPPLLSNYLNNYQVERVVR